MSDSSSSGSIWFNVVHNDGAIQVTIVNGFATFEVFQIEDVGVLIRAINMAVKRGGRKGTIFTNDVVNPNLAAKHTKRAEKGTTWLGGVTTQLPDGLEYPRFRIDWDELPIITT